MTNDQKDAVILNALRSLPVPEVEPDPAFTPDVMRRLSRHRLERARRFQTLFAAACLLSLALAAMEGWSMHLRNEELSRLRSANTRLASALRQSEETAAKALAEAARERAGVVPAPPVVPVAVATAVPDGHARLVERERRQLLDRLAALLREEAAPPAAAGPLPHPESRGVLTSSAPHPKKPPVERAPMQ